MVGGHIKEKQARPDGNNKVGEPNLSGAHSGTSLVFDCFILFCGVVVIIVLLQNARIL
jgi:hypothetical protein